MLARDEYESALYLSWLRVREDKVAANTANMTREQTVGLKRQAER